MTKLPPHLKTILNNQNRPKYGNQKVHCLSKHLHDSKLEANYCNRLLAMKQNGEILGYEIQQVFNLDVNGILICKHVVDFFVRVGMGLKYEVHDTKGIATKDWIIKRKLFEALYPHIPYRVITAH